MQKEITAPQPLLNGSGNIACPGYAKRLLWEYNRENITAPKWRIKEWDYYYIGCDEHALCLTIADMGYVGALSISVLDFLTPSQFTNSAVSLFPMGKMNMPRTSAAGVSSWKCGKTHMTFEVDGDTRRLTGFYRNADKKGHDVSFDITLSNTPEESMVIATPFDKPGYFYYNQKINCMTASGRFTVGDKVRKFYPETSLATLDWGRGVWTYDNTWYWSSLQTRLDDGSTFGWNLGYGFGDTSAAGEDMLFYRGKSHKIGRTRFLIPSDDKGTPDFMAPWRIVSDDARLDCTFKPLIDRYAPLDLKVMCMIPHQVFGYASGKCILDDGTVIELKQKLCFAEKVHNKW